MNRRAFEELNDRRRVAAGFYFHQRRLRRHHCFAPRFGLCAALVEIWWEGVRNGGDVLPSLQLPTPEFVREIVSRQCRGAYPLELPADEALLGPADRALFELKYKTSDLQEIAMLAAEHGAASPLELDLQLRHCAALVESRAWPDCRLAPPVAAVAPDEPGLRLMLLRYAGSGHRMAFLVDPGGACRFFDPNSGEVRFARAGDFADWLADFWEVAGHQRRAPTVGFYRFRPDAPAATSIRGN